MCEYPSGIFVWPDGKGLQVFAGPTLASHLEAVSLHKLPIGVPVVKWCVVGGKLSLAHDQRDVDDATWARYEAEALRLWPTIDAMLARCVKNWPAEISDADRGLAVRNAARYGHLACVKSVLASGAISDADRGLAVLNAAWDGHLACLKAALASGAISDEYRGLAVLNAALYGHIDCLKELLASGEISAEYRGLAVWDAAYHGHTACVALLEQ